MTFDRQGRCLFANSEGLSLMKMQENSVVGRLFQDFWPEELCDMIDHHVMVVLSGRRTSFAAYRMNGAEKTWWNMSMSPIRSSAGEVERFVSLGTVITAHKQAEETIRRFADDLERQVIEQTRELKKTEARLNVSVEELLLSQAQLTTIIDSLPFDLFGIDREGRYFIQNEASRQIYGNLLGKRPEDVCQDERQLAIWLDNNQRAFAGEVVRGEVEWKVGDGKKYFYNVIAPFAFRGRIEGIVGFNIDITERRQMERALRESILTARTLLDTPIAIGLLLDRDGRCIDTNETFARRFDRQVSDIVGLPVWDLFPSEVRERRKALLQEVIETKKQVRYEDDRQGFWSDTIIAPILDDSGEVARVAVFAFDITERKRIEHELRDYQDHLEDIVAKRTEEISVLNSQLLQSQKLEAIGVLAGGVAHEFSNILAAMKGAVYMLQKKVPAESALKKYADQIASSMGKATLLSQGLLSFSRGQMISLHPMPVNEVIARVVRLSGQLIGEHIELTLQLGDERAAVMADANQIEQVLMNLLTNARDAMPDGGNLTIGTDLTEMDETFIKKRGFGRTGRYAVLTVADDGCGMTADVRAKIFQPFYTTKSVGKGSGLGLAVTYGIIKQHNGFIDVTSSPGKGTTFTIYLPTIDMESAHDRGEDLTPVRTGSERILLVEDDADTLTVMRDLFEITGYTVITAADGDEAVRTFIAHQDEIDLVVADVRMPKKDGRRVYEEIKEIAPAVRFLFISGYAADVLDSHGILKEKLEFISKAARPEELLAKVREVLDA